MTTPVPTRFAEHEIAALDRLVDAGLGRNRSEVVRLAVRQLDDATRRRAVGDAIIESYRLTPQSDDELRWAMANAVAMTEDEPW